jgi:hypothetical protein
MLLYRWIDQVAAQGAQPFECSRVVKTDERL